MRLDRAEVSSLLLSLSLVGTFKVVSICGRLLQGCVGDVHFFMGINALLEKVRHKKDLQDTDKRIFLNEYN